MWLGFIRMNENIPLLCTPANGRNDSESFYRV